MEKTAEQIEADRELEIKQRRLAAEAPASMMDLLIMLLEAIFGSFNDTKSEFSEIDEKDAEPSRRETGSGAAGSFISAVNLENLRKLTAQYADKKLVNTSPFDSTATITSGLGQRERPTAGASREHKGLDLVPQDKSASGIEVHSTMPGVVVRSETQRNKKGEMAGFGNWVEVACIDGTRRRYAHLASKVEVGTILHQGDVLGVMGNTGTGTGPHLHYEIRTDKGQVLEPVIDGKQYARNDKSYVGSHVSPASEQKAERASREYLEARGEKPGPIRLASAEKPAAADKPIVAPKAEGKSQELSLIDQIKTQAQKFDVSDAVQGAKDAGNRGMNWARSAIGAVIPG